MCGGLPASRDAVRPGRLRRCAGSPGGHKCSGNALRPSRQLEAHSSFERLRPQIGRAQAIRAQARDGGFQRSDYAGSSLTVTKSCSETASRKRRQGVRPFLPTPCRPLALEVRSTTSSTYEFLFAHSPLCCGSNSSARPSFLRENPHRSVPVRRQSFASSHRVLSAALLRTDCVAR